LAYVRGVDAFMNSFSGVSAYAIRKGFQSIGAEDNSVVIFSELMDSNSLFLTANADTIYNLAILDLTKGPLVVEVPPKALGTLNDMWFGWIIDIGGPGPDRGQGGKYLILPPGYDGPLPDNGFFVGRSKTTHALYAVRAYLENNDPKPAVALIKDRLKIYPYTPGGYGTSIATALEGKVRLEVNPPVPPTKFVCRALKLALQEIYRPVKIREGDRVTSLSGFQVVMRQLMTQAAKGNGPAGRMLIEQTFKLEQDLAREITDAEANLPAEGSITNADRARALAAFVSKVKPTKQEP
jgi:Protein of unknown function (DUF1254)/Family of unknown function (DUF5681)